MALCAPTLVFRLRSLRKGQIPTTQIPEEEEKGRQEGGA